MKKKENVVLQTSPKQVVAKVIISEWIVWIATKVVAKAKDALALQEVFQMPHFQHMSQVEQLNSTPNRMVVDNWCTPCKSIQKEIATQRNQWAFQDFIQWL